MRSITAPAGSQQTLSAPVSEFTLDGVDIVADEDEAYVEFDNGKTGSRRDKHNENTEEEY